MKEKIYSEDIKFVEDEINVVRHSIPNEILEVKSDLLSVYLMNLVLYNELSEEEKTGNPIVEILIKTTILLEKVCLMEKKAELVIKAAAQEKTFKPNKLTTKKEAEGDKRSITKEMMRNKFVVRKRKIEDRTPRLKYKNKARKLAERAEVKYDNNIDTQKIKTNKFG